MSEKEKTSLDSIVEKVNQMDDGDAKYILGVVDGMAIANISNTEPKKEAG